MEHTTYTSCKVHCPASRKLLHPNCTFFPHGNDFPAESAVACFIIGRQKPEVESTRWMSETLCIVAPDYAKANPCSATGLGFLTLAGKVRRGRRGLLAGPTRLCSDHQTLAWYRTLLGGLQSTLAVHERGQQIRLTNCCLCLGTLP